MRPRNRDKFLRDLRSVLTSLRNEKLKEFSRHVSVGDLLMDREETARYYGFGEGSTCYDNVLIIGNVTVGKHTWIGPNVILDGSGGLEIGDYVSISAGVQIYSHHTVNWSVSEGKNPIDKSPTTIGNGVYIGPNAVVQMGISIGAGAIVGALSFVNRDLPAGVKAYGVPARVYSN